MAGIRTWNDLLFLLLLSVPLGYAFIPIQHNKRQFEKSESPLHGIAEWRKEALVPGQSRTILLKEGRFFDLIDDAIDSHISIVGMVLMGDDGIIMAGMPLCQIVNV
jgi:hypothetical protein